MKKIAILLTCFNRKEKTINCLNALLNGTKKDSGIFLKIYLVDDGSKDGTEEAVKEHFPFVNLIKGTGTLFWAGGMRLAWQTALNTEKYNYFLLLNDDTILLPGALNNLINSNCNSAKKNKVNGITIGTTTNETTGKITYGGNALTGHFSPDSKKVYHDTIELDCDMGNANIMLVPEDIVDKIGILSEKYTHGIADYDYTLRAKKAGFWVNVSPGTAGYCIDDHGKSWKSSNVPFNERVKFLYSNKGLSYKEYLYFIKTHFPLYQPVAFAKLWLKTIFPFLYDRFK